MILRKGEVTLIDSVELRLRDFLKRVAVVDINNFQ